MFNLFLKIVNFLHKPKLVSLGFFFIVSLHAKDLAFFESKYDLNDIATSFRWNRLIDKKNINLDQAQEYFLTFKNGDVDHLQELKASLKMLLDKNTDVNKEFICKFPARAIFLSNIFKELNPIDTSFCKEYSRWTGDNSIDDISFIYVNGYLENPASFFGHTLLKFNSSKTIKANDLLNLSLNYGANTGNDKAVPYVIRGLTGQYKATLQPEKFFRLSAQYQEFQMRDMWEFKLSLSNFEKDLLLAFTFEMLKKEYIYYFLSDNCAYRINRIIGFAVGKDPLPNLLWSSPIDLLHGLEKESLIDEPSHFPSLYSQALESFKALSIENKNLYKEYFRSTDSIISNEDPELGYALLQNLNYQKLKNFKKNKIKAVTKIDNQRQQILLNLKPKNIDNYNYNAEPPTVSNFPTKVSHILQFNKLKYSNGPDKFYSIKLEGSNFTLLELDGYRTKNSEFIFLSPEISLYQDGARLKQLTLFKILSLDDELIKLPNENKFSWGVDSGIRQVTSDCFPCSQFFFEAMIGKTLSLTNNISFTLMPFLAVHENEQDRGETSSGARLFSIYRLNKTRMYFEIEDTNFSNAKSWNSTKYSFKLQQNIDKSRSFRVEVFKDDFAKGLMLSINKYY